MSLNGKSTSTPQMDTAKCRLPTAHTFSFANPVKNTTFECEGEGSQMLTQDGPNSGIAKHEVIKDPVDGATLDENVSSMRLLSNPPGSYQDLDIQDNARDSTRGVGLLPDTTSKGHLPSEIHRTLDSGQSGPQTHEDTADSEVRPTFSSHRMSSRSKTFTEKGLSYNIAMSVKRYKSAVSAHKRKETKCLELLQTRQLGISKLLKARTDIEKSMIEVSEAFNRANEIVPDHYNECMGEVLICQDSYRSLLFDLTKCIQELENEVQSHTSKHSRSSAGSVATKSHKSKQSAQSGSGSGSLASSNHSSVASIKALAAANAAALRTKLKYFEAEIEQKTKLDKLQMMRDLEIEEAKLTAMQEIESDKSSQGSCVSLSRHSTSSSKRKVIYQHANHGDTVSKLFTDQIDHTVNSHAKEDSEGVCSQLAALSTGNGIVGQTSYGVTDPQKGVKLTSVKHNTTLVNRATDLNLHAPAFVPSNNATKTVNNHCVRQQVTFSDPISCPVDHATTAHSFNHPRNNIVSPATLHDASYCSAHSYGSEMPILIQSINHLANINRLPIPEPEIFEGEPLDYPEWKAAFHALIEGREIDPCTKIHYLKKYLNGDAKRCVAGFLASPSAESFDAAMALIESRFGDSFTIANAFKNKIETWPKISPRDSQGLRQYSDFLRQCEVASHTNPSLQVLNDDIQNRVMLSKLPDWLVSRWARHVYRFREQFRLYPSFADFVLFLVKESDIACDPVTCLTKQQDKKNVNSFNTISVNCRCTFCDKENHLIENCFKFKEKTMEEKKIFIMDNRLCFGCLKSGHISQSCTNRLKCSECNRQHPTPLHGDVKPKPDLTATRVDNSVQSNATKSAGSIEKSESSQPPESSSHISLATNDGTCSKSTMIVPVWISSRDNEKEFLIYALLDTQSDTTFVSKYTFAKLGISATDTKLSLSTMTSERRTIPSKRVEGLRVRGHDSNIMIQLPTAYLHDSIPASRNSIPTPEMTATWPHLKSMSRHLLPKGDYDIGLLIGYNCPQALTPREVIPGKGNNPFAQRTDLGWGIIGLIQAENVHVFSTFTKSCVTLKTSAAEIFPNSSCDFVPHTSHHGGVWETYFQPLAPNDLFPMKCVNKPEIVEIDDIVLIAHDNSQRYPSS